MGRFHRPRFFVGSGLSGIGRVQPADNFDLWYCRPSRSVIERLFTTTAEVSGSEVAA
jgi:hypothetical protein